jgi:hypothetical protein
MVLPLIGAIASIGSALIGANAANKAAQTQAAATREASQIQRQNFTDTQAMLQPQIAAGDTARRYQLGALGLPGGAGYDESIAAFRTSPGYEFALNQGRDQVMTGAAAGGNLFSGRTLKDLGRFGQGMADQQFGNWFNRVGGIAGQGGQATGTMANVGMGTAGNLSDLATRGGDARASSYINSANAITGGAQNLANLYSYYNPPAWVKQPMMGGTQFNPNTASQGFIT